MCWCHTSLIAERRPLYWQQHAVSVQQSLVTVPPERHLVLVGHSGVGPLLPVLAQAARHPVTAYLFVDAGLPHLGKSQLEEMPEQLRWLLAEGARFPNWKDEDLREVLPDGPTRQQILAEVQPRPLSFFEEVLPDDSCWPDAPGGYLLLTQGYRTKSGASTASRVAEPNATCRAFSHVGWSCHCGCVLDQQMDSRWLGQAGVCKAYGLQGVTFAMGFY
jgi:hypothetical protein